MERWKRHSKLPRPCPDNSRTRKIGGDESHLPAKTTTTTKCSIEAACGNWKSQPVLSLTSRIHSRGPLRSSNVRVAMSHPHVLHLLNVETRRVLNVKASPRVPKHEKYGHLIQVHTLMDFVDCRNESWQYEPQANLFSFLLMLDYPHSMGKAGYSLTDRITISRIRLVFSKKPNSLGSVLRNYSTFSCFTGNGVILDLDGWVIC